MRWRLRLSAQRCNKDVFDAMGDRLHQPTRVLGVYMHFTRRELLVGGCALAAACGSEATAPLSSENKVIPRDYFGIHYQGAGDRQLTGPASSWGIFDAGSIRIWNLGLNWRQIEPAQGIFDWALFDRLINSAAAAQMDVLYVLGQSPDWAAGPHKGRFGSTYNPLPPRSADDWANYVTAVVRRYRGKIHAYELWNEQICQISTMATRRN